jgi:hypothetical protein
MQQDPQEIQNSNQAVAVASCADSSVPPVRITHRMIGVSHVFESPDLEGLYVGDADLAQAFDLILTGVRVLTFAIRNLDIDWTLDVSFAEVKNRIANKPVHAAATSSFGAWLIANAGTLPKDFDFDSAADSETDKNSRFRTILTPEDAELVISMIENPPEPAEALVKAMMLSNSRVTKSN